MTARLQDGHPKTRLTLSAGEEVRWQADRRQATQDRRHAAEREARYPLLIEAHPARRIDWYRVGALIVVAIAAALTFLGFWVACVYVLTAF